MEVKRYKCAFCGNPYVRVRVDQVCCQTQCSLAYKNLERTRAARLYRALYHWRLWKSSSRAGVMGVADNLRFICREIRAWIEEDKRIGRPPPHTHSHDLDRGHQRKGAV